MLLSLILDKIKYDCSNFKDSEISLLCYDSRKACEGALFVCLKGTSVDGHDFIKAAYDKGCRVFAVEKITDGFEDALFILFEDTRKALALMSANFFNRPADRLFLIGITGTKGKTSISFMLRSIFEEAGHKVGIIGTTGIIYDSVFEKSDNSTPESYEIHRHFSEMEKVGVDVVVMEVSSQGLMMHRTYGITFDAAIYTNLSPDHIGASEHKSFEEYRDCKSILFSQCREAFANADDENFAYITAPFGKRPVLYSIDKKSDIRAENIEFTSDSRGLKTSYDLCIGQTSFEVRMNIPGKFTVYNSLAAASCALTFGCEPNQVCAGLAKAVVEGRMEKVNTGLPFSTIIDYAHNELSMENLYETINHYPHGRIITVFGCGGNRAKARRYDMGRIAMENSDVCIITSDNPRFEKLEDINADIMIGIKQGLEKNKNGQYEIVNDRKSAICHAMDIANNSDVIIIPGKGHQHYEEIEGVKIPFNEREIIEEYANRKKENK